MSKELLKNIIEDFNPDKFSGFFREKNRKFERTKENLSEYNDDKFIGCTKLGEIKFESDNTFFVLIKSKNELTEKSAKKLQYEKAKKILKDRQADSGIFIFYDTENNFRFSLVYADYVGRREWSSFKRFTFFVKQGLTNKTFLDRIGGIEFESLAKIKEAFSVDKVTKEFYKDIANWYFWAVDNSRFPDSAEEIENGRNIAVIRLITRLIFIWFMKELKLIPENLFKKSFAEDVLKDLNDDDSTYYKAILQNLFFATLSTPKEQREFAGDKRYNNGYNEDFGNQNVFRYHELFKKPDDLKSYFDDIPFLNGGLFECLDKGNEDYYIDGFTRRKKYQPVIPNILFFSAEKEKDLNKWYGTKNKKYKVKGLLEILSSYNFTVDENTPEDLEVALDPELLGKVFENLLASFNPETSTTARKATGSFYTPREIVDYMVTESLKEYFKTHLGESEDVKLNLDKLFNPLEQENPFIDNSKETRRLISLIENVKIVDPAVGSGAFPMGILNKLVFVLNKIDKGNKLWKEAQLKSVENIQDSRLRDETINHIENYFKNKNPDYGRKLYLIQRCIYGVDIQQIAVEIAKLRFFISLLIDERIDKSKPNWNIEPLPNLDFKIMQGNSLLEEYEGIKLFDESLFENIDDSKLNQLNILKRKQKSIQDEVLVLNKNGKYTAERKLEYSKKLEEVSRKIEALRLGRKTSDNIFDIFDTHLETNQKRDDLTKLHREYFEVNEKSEKDKIKKNIEKLEWELIEATLISQGKRNKLDELDKIRKSNTKPFFLWKLHFPEVFINKGFDIVIGNPPYIQLQKDGGKLANLYKDCGFQTFERTGDIYSLFYEKGISLLKILGHICFITSNKWMIANYGKLLREYFINLNPLILIDLGPGVFENATVDVNIILIQKSENKNELIGVEISQDARNNKLIEYINRNLFGINYISSESWYLGNKTEQILRNKIMTNGVNLGNWGINIFRGILTGYNKAFFINNTTKEEICKKEPISEKIFKKIIRGRDIKRYYYEWSGLWVIFIPWHFPLQNDKTIQGASKNAESEFMKLHPTVYAHLKEYRKDLESRNKDETGIRYEWYALQRCANTYYQEFEKEKIVFKAVGKNLSFSLLERGNLVTAPASFLTSNNNLYLLGVLCSKYAQYYIYKHSDKTGAGDIMLNVQSFEKIPVPPISRQNSDIVRKIELITREIINLKLNNNDTLEHENQNDELVYKLFNLNKEEIKIIENNT